MFTKNRRSPQHHSENSSPAHINTSKSRNVRQISPAKSRASSSGGHPVSVSWQREPSNPRGGMSLENIQSYGGAYSVSQGYMDPSMSRSPYHSPTHVGHVGHMRSNSATNISMKTATRYMSDRDLAMSDWTGSASLDRYGNLPMGRDGGREGGRELVRDSRESRDAREYQRLHDPRVPLQRERSLERDYPYMGARSLERDTYYRKVGRSHSIEMDPSYAMYLAQTLPAKQAEPHPIVRDTTIFDMQTQIMDLTKECAVLQHEIDNAKSKLSSCMNSIKTFWSPELKKERSARKDETSKYLTLNEQYKAAQVEMQRYKALLNDADGMLTSLKTLERLPHAETEAQKKDSQILRKTIEELELRIDTQKQTLQTRDESIKKLLEMLQSKGLSTGSVEEDRQTLEKLQRQIVEDSRRLKQSQDLLTLRDREIATLSENVVTMNPPANSASTQALIEAKEARIATLENQVLALEEESLARESDPTKNRKTAATSGTIDRPADKQLRAELEVLKNELAKKDNEIIGVTMKSETMEKQQLEHQQYIQVLKEQINAKELHASMLQSDIEDLRERMKEKEELMDKKAKLLITTQTEKRRMESENAEMKEHLEIKDRKIVVLQRKIENLEDVIREHENNLSQTQAKVATLTHGQSSSDSQLAQVQDSLTDKERLVEKLKEQRTVADKEHQEESTTLRGQTQELKTKIEALQSDLSTKQAELCELRDELNDLKGEKLKLESAVKEYELMLQSKEEQIDVITEQLNKAKEVVENKTSDVDPEVWKESQAKIDELSSQIMADKDEIHKMQQELDRLLEILRETEDEKHVKDNHLKELQDTVKEYKSKLGVMKRNNQMEKTMNAQMLEEARKREEDTAEVSSTMEHTMKEKDDRIEELEEALRESVTITAERELAMAEQDNLLIERQGQVDKIEPEIRGLKTTIEDHTNTIAILNKQLEDREAKIKRYGVERRKQMDEVYEMKQEALQAAICEKDANIALIELTSSKMNRNFDETKKLQQEKSKLQEQLKEVSQNRIRLHEDRHNGHRRASNAKVAKSTTASSDSTSS